MWYLFNFLTTEAAVFLSFLMSYQIKCMEPKDNCLLNLDLPLEPKEVKTALFSIGSLKSPGVDGFPALFYQKHWNLCGDDIIKLVSTAFSTGTIPEGLNHTLITLVPKIQSPKHMHLFRPISLCCTVYKVITKIIVSRIRPYLIKWISPNQASYVPGRHIADNIMITQEILHKCRVTHGNKGFLVWKIDLSKAYDKLNWNFIEQVLYELQLPPLLTKLIMHCISSASFQITINGDLSDKFCAGRGIRQGDPLSPYIFVLCMEKLSHLIQSAIEVGEWKPIKSSMNGPYVSHLFFADDLILFAEASTQQAKVLKKCMDIFCELSGQSVNFDKSKLYCSPNISNSLATEISHICGSPLTTDLGKYLGMPLIHSRVSKTTYSDLVDKVQNRLAGWKSKTLSMAGRLTLIQAVTASIPVYAMQTAKLPASTCDTLDKLNRDFLWGDCDGKKKIHLVNWDTVCRPKVAGGLGIKKTSVVNKVMLAKTGWRIMQKDEGLWCSIFQRKYLQNTNLLNPTYKKPTLCSSTWSSVCFGASLLRQGLIWRIGNGASVFFWTDHWSDCGLLADKALDPSMVDNELLVQDFWIDNDWDITLLYACLPPEVVEKILCTPTSRCSQNDKLIWKHTPNGTFSVKSAYFSSFDHTNMPHGKWKSIWSLPFPPKLKIFSWLFCQSRLLTNVNRLKRHLTSDPCCKYCPGIPETMTHLFKDCPKASDVWKAIVGPATMQRTFSLDWDAWVAANILQKNYRYHDFQWSQVFIFTCWFIWKWRNKRIFDPSFHDHPNAEKPILQYLTEWTATNKKATCSSPSEVHFLSWQKPNAGFYKLNVDGTRSQNGVIGAGGVIRDNNGVWCHGFMRHIGRGEVLQAEAWGLFSGLQLAKELDINQITVESDSAVLVSLIHNYNSELHPLGTLISNCQHLINSFRTCNLVHIHREKNRVADYLAKRSIDQEIGMCVLYSAPVFVIPSILDDIAGLATPRLISAALAAG